MATFPEFTRTNLSASRLKIATATLTFHGCAPSDQGHPHASVWIPQDAATVVNGQEFYGRVAFAFKAGHDSPPAWRIDYANGSLYRQQSGGLTDFARNLVRDFMLKWCAEQGDPLTMRAAELARLQEFADAARAHAKELREQADEADASAQAHQQVADDFRNDAGDYLALCDGSRALEFVFSEAFALKFSAQRAKDKRDRSAARYGEPMPLHEHDFLGILRPFTGEWLAQPERDAAEAANEAERAAMRAKA